MFNEEPKNIYLIIRVQGATSVIGVSRTLSGPYLSKSPFEIWEIYNPKKNKTQA